MKKIVAFDSSLSLFVEVLSQHLTVEVIENGWVLRDASGHLTFVAASPIVEELAEKLVTQLKSKLGKYCRENCVLDTTFPGASGIISSIRSFTTEVYPAHNRPLNIRFIDRRVVGQDWLIQPAAGWQPPAPARIVFASLKGGVGRSTALAVLAADLSERGKKVLAIDLDLEAPGIGTMLLKTTDQPKFGTLDWYVERAIHGSDYDYAAFATDMVEASPLALGSGLIHVVPAVGHTSDKYPQNVLAKIARAYLGSPQNDGPMRGFLEETQELIAQLSAINSYDVILVDARAGLNESTAAALLGLGADVMLFGIDTPQTFASYRYLLSHLARFPRNDDDDWLYRFRMIHAKASRDTELQKAFRDRAYDIFKEFLYRDIPLLDADGHLLLDASGAQLSPRKEFGLTEPVAPHFAWPVLSDAHFSEFDPCTKESQMKPEFYKETYSELLKGVHELLGIVGGNS